MTTLKQNKGYCAKKARERRHDPMGTRIEQIAADARRDVLIDFDTHEVSIRGIPVMMTDFEHSMTEAFVRRPAGAARQAITTQSFADTLGRIALLSRCS